MTDYQDEREQTQTCFKLHCGHAFHTKCIIECLQQTNHTCPSCNRHKDIRDDLTREGLIIQLISDIKHSSAMKPILQEIVHAKNELLDTTNQIKRDLKEYADQKKEELKFNEKRAYFLKCLAIARSIATHEAKQKSPMHIAVLHQNREHTRFSLDRHLVGTHSSTLWRLKNPYISFPL